MIKLKTLLIENPDTLKYDGKMYKYTSPANRSAFFVYRDKVTNKNELFGYSDIKEDFFSSDPSVVTDINEGKYNNDGLYYINYLRKSKNGGGHNSLEQVLYSINRIQGDAISRARIFEVKGEDDKKVIVCSFWDEKSDALRFIDFWKQSIEFNGYKPEEILYEPYKNFYTYEQFVDPNYVAGESPDVTSKKFDLSVGDTVKFKGMEMYGVILSISGGGQSRVQITRPFPGGGGGDWRRV